MWDDYGFIIILMKLIKWFPCHHWYVEQIHDTVFRPKHRFENNGLLITTVIPVTTKWPYKLNNMIKGRKMIDITRIKNLKYLEFLQTYLKSLHTRNI